MKAMERQIEETILTDWRGGIPLDDLLTGEKMCLEYPDLHGCDAVQAQLQDISDSLSSCRADHRSTLCQVVVRVIGKHPVASILPRADAIQLPENPFYWNLPTAALEAQAGNFGYREEAASWWFKAWRTTIISCFALLLLTSSAWVWWSRWNKEKQKRATLLAKRQSERAKQERAIRDRAERERIEAERQAKLAREAEAAEQKRLVAEMAARQKEAEAAAKLATEQAEAALLLNTLVGLAKPKKRRKHDDSAE